MRKVTITEVDLGNGESKLSIDTAGFNSLEALGALQMATYSFLTAEIKMRHAEKSETPIDPPCQTC